MSAIRNVTRLTAALGVAAAVTLGLTAAPAQAAPVGALTAALTITGSGSECKVTVGGNIKMEQARAQALIDSGATARVEVWADDSYFDNRLIKLPNAQLIAGSPRNGNGLIVLSVNTVSCVSKLDEDPWIPYDMSDEIYAKVIFESPGSSRITKQTNTVTRRFGFGE